jgi:hypothetical protein
VASGWLAANALGSHRGSAWTSPASRGLRGETATITKPRTCRASTARPHSASGSPARVAARFELVKDELYRTRWVVYAKRPFGGPEQVFRYLGRYTHRVGLSNGGSSRSAIVIFRTHGEQTATLAPDEFLRRFLLHVLPKGFVKIRRYGLMAASNVTTRLAAPPSPPRSRSAVEQSLPRIRHQPRHRRQRRSPAGAEEADEVRRACRRSCG